MTYFVIISIVIFSAFLWTLKNEKHFENLECIFLRNCFMTFSGWWRLFSNLTLIVIRGNSLRVSVFCFFISWYFLNSLLRKDLLCIVGMPNIFFYVLFLLLSILRHIIFVIFGIIFLKLKFNNNLVLNDYYVGKKLTYIKKM